MYKRFSIAVTALLVIALTGGCAPEEPADDEISADTSVADPIAVGEESYTTYCASCHGREGKGDGPVSLVLTVKPADLTVLAAKNGGTFPTDSIYAYIDGRQDVQAHGPRTMPVWGNIWSEREGEPVRQEEVDQRIKELVEFLRTIQVASDSADVAPDTTSIS